MPAAAVGLAAFEAVLSGTSPDQQALKADPILARLSQVMAERSAGRPIGIADLAALIRHALMARSTPCRPEKLRFRKAQDLPSAREWASYGLAASDLGDDLLLSPQAWKPEWIGPPAIPDEDVFAEVFRGLEVRAAAEVPIDPGIDDATGHEKYSCPGQREAIRSLLYMPEGSTLFVNLPTGSGKTLVGQLPPLLGGADTGLAVFIVPTNALAIDQEQRFQKLLATCHPHRLAHEYAWYSKLPQRTKDAIRDRVRNGTQQILFTSPESAAGALLPALYHAAERGTLKYLVVDEAHIVADWGDGFRPAFQALAGIRRGLLRRCTTAPFRTVLMSATISATTLATLETLFGPEVQMVSAVHLRPEPYYRSVRAGSRTEQRNRVLELLRRAPRPFLLYVTEPQQAEDWLALLRQNGLQRICSFSGPTPAPQKAAIIDAWRENRLDGIVATSAFGVGMDKSDVRTIIHAVIPESLDRYYQEVGRGGRDGCASIAVIVYTDEDYDAARRMGRPRFLGDDNAYDRWKRMFLEAKRISGEDLISVDITTVPDHLQQRTDYNATWNVRTLLMLARSGVIEIDSLPPQPPVQAPGESDGAYDARLDVYWARFNGTMTLRTLTTSHLDRESFETATADDRARARSAAQRSFSALLSAIEGREEMGRELARLYSIDTPDRTVIVTRACRGCPKPNAPEHADTRYSIPYAASIARIDTPSLSVWRSRWPTRPRNATIHFDRAASDIETTLRAALTTLVGLFGLPEIVAPQQAWAHLACLPGLHQSAPRKFLIARRLEEELAAPSPMPLPRVTLLWPWPIARIPDPVLLLDRPLHVIVAPRDVPSDHPLRRHIDTADHLIPIEDFLRVSNR